MYCTVALTFRPTIRVVAQLYRKRTKTFRENQSESTVKPVKPAFTQVGLDWIIQNGDLFMLARS